MNAAEFWESYTPEPNSGCWLWTRAYRPLGYGHVNFDGRTDGAHRVAWALTFGPIPRGMFVCHRCDTPACINPDHLFLGTHTDNMRDATVKGRMGAPQRAHCKNGHPFVAENVRVRRDGGGRQCAPCQRERHRKWKARAAC